jgi:hypothetical protein
MLNLTQEGVALLKEAVPLWRKVQQSVSRSVGSSSGLELREQLTRLA